MVKERNEAKGKAHEAALAQPWRLDMTRFRHMFGSAFPAPVQEQDVIVMNAIKSLATEMLDYHEKAGSLLSGNVQSVPSDADQGGLDVEDDTHRRLFSDLRVKPDEDP